MSFNKFANSYGKYNIIQKKIIQKYIPFTHNKIVDLGCGSEGLCKYKNFEFYLGIDNSKEMLKLNPCNTKLCDFNTKKCFNEIKKYNFSQIVSFSALQWAKNLEFVFKEIKELNKDFLLAIFTSNTFKTLHNYLQITSPIYSKEEILQKASILDYEYELFEDKLYFSSPIKLLQYIKYSGVKGDVKTDTAKILKFVKEFPFNYLEFEVVILRKRGRRKED
jgi:malonyl-CoA O-methyltransferase